MRALVCTVIACALLIVGHNAARAWLPDLTVINPTYSPSTDSVIVTVFRADDDRIGLVRLDYAARTLSTTYLPCGHGLPQATAIRAGKDIVVWSMNDGASSVRSISLRDGKSVWWPNLGSDRILDIASDKLGSIVYLARAKGDAANYARAEKYISTLDFATMRETRMWPASSAMGLWFYQLQAPNWIEGGQYAVQAMISSHGALPSWTSETNVDGTHLWLVRPHSDEIAIHPHDKAYSEAEGVQKLGDRIVLISPDDARAEKIVVIGPKGTQVYQRPPRGFWPPSVFARPDGRLYALTIDPIGKELRLTDLAAEREVGKWAYNELQAALAAQKCDDALVPARH